MSEVYVDGTTPLNAAHMNALQQKIEKAAVNGYASLDATGKVPSAQLPVIPAGITYKGDWAAGSYNDGDIVVYQGVEYMAVRGTSAAPVAWPVPGAPGQPTYGTTLPASPVDGQEAILVDSITNPSYQWRFRYNVQSSSPYKWEFVGGAPLFASTDAVENISSASYADLATIGPQVTLPRAGEYIAQAASYISPSSGQNASVGLSLAGAVASDAIYANGLSSIDSSSSSAKFAAAAGNVLKMQYRSSSGPGTFARRRLSVLPARVA